MFFYGNLEVTPHGTLNISAYFMLHKVTSVSGRESPASNPTAIEPNVGCFEISKKNHIRYFNSGRKNPIRLVLSTFSSGGEIGRSY